MHKYRIFAVVSVGVLFMVMIELLGAVSATAQSGGGYELTRSTIASSTLAGAGGYTLNATAGQAEARGWGGNGFVLFGGFWGGGQFRMMYRIWLPFTGSYIIVNPGTNRGE